MQISRSVLVVLCVLNTAGSTSCLHADWPMYRADASRSGISRELIKFPLSLQWHSSPRHKPRPAWPNPVKERHRLDFDYAPQLIVAAGTVYFGTSVDDTLSALDAKTGRKNWAFTTGGPIRFAPAYSDGRVYVTSDDGFLYCLRAVTGKLLWKFHAADTNSLVLGNERLISRRPLRSGVLVDRGVVFVTAGMWPSEGVLIYALEAATGEVHWCNDTSDTRYLAQPHAKASSLTGVSPQGYLLATDKLLLVPTGRGVPAAFDRATGRLEYFKPADSKTHGGCWATISGDRLFNGGLVYESSSGNQVPCESTRTPLWAKRDFDFGTRQHVLGYRGDRIITDGDRVFGRRTGHCLALTGNALLEGDDGILSAFDPKSKNVSTAIWSTKVTGQVRSIAVSEGAIFSATDSGDLYVFGPDKASHDVPAVAGRSNNAHRAGSDAAAAVLDLAASTSITTGYILVAGNPELATSLARDDRFHILSLVDEDQVSGHRRRLVEEGIYGSRIAVQSLQTLKDGHLPPYFANLVVVGGRKEALNVDELWRIVRPCGGLVCFDTNTASLVTRLVDDAEDKPTQVEESNGLTWLRRGKLPGAFDWDSKVTSDQRVKWPLELAWFGGPGPDRMQDRHQASVAPPVVANGRYFVSGARHIIAVDAYNGTELWSRQFAEEVDADRSKQVRLSGLTANDDSVFFQLGGTWLQLDARTGEETDTLKSLPEGLGVWGRIAKRELPFATHLRTHALTGENVPRTYFRTYGCNQLLVADGVDFFRSGTLGLYDLIDDSGLRNFGGIRPGCSRSHNAAFGVFLSSEGSSGCKCTYNFQTSLMLAPARTRRQEDWAVYHDLPAEGLVQGMNINLGAPGDRRDKDGKLWLSYPRPTGEVALQIPVAVESRNSELSGPYHFDSDRRKIHNTQRPWIYTTGYRGLRKVTIALDQQQPLVTNRMSKSPQIDGRMDDKEWPSQPQASLRPVQNRQSRGAPNRRLIDPEKWSSFVRLAHDDSHLFVSYQQPNRLDRRGQPYEWRKKTRGDDASIWQDDSFELFLSDTSKTTVLHFGVSASGATCDARLEGETEREDTRWDGQWDSSTIADEKAFVIEIAIPWSTLTEAGLSTTQLLVNAQSNWSGWRSPLRFLGSRGRLACENFAPLGLDVAPTSPDRRFRIRLHFADPDLNQTERRRFDVRIQGRTVLSEFDMQSEAGARNTAVVKEFHDILGAENLTIELAPVDSDVGPSQETILTGIELQEEMATKASP
jgi:outer membrane protein assembly factor BamB